ncbi:MAG: Mur ligase family protein [Bdellovibrionales bacterium]
MPPNATSSSPRKTHFIGLAGAGMSAVAKLLRESGATVIGSDEAAYPPVSDYLKSENLTCRSPYATSNIDPDVTDFVIGKNARLVPETNAEVAGALASGKPVRSFPEILKQLAEGKETAIVAGSYGKSSCASLLAHGLIEAQTDPSWFIGAIPLSPTSSASLGQGKIFVMEGDEYPSSNFDDRAKFLHYAPRHLLLTPLAHDHVNVYPTPESYLRPFAQLVSNLPKDAPLVLCLDGDLSKIFKSSLPSQQSIVTYGLAKGDYRPANILWGETTRFTLMRDGEPIIDLETSQLGEHNIENIVGVGALLLSQNLISPETFARAVASFKGVRRRLDRKSEATSIPIYEAFGSSREKARSAIAAMRRHYPNRRLVIVFEPHTFSWRNRAALSWYDDVFDGASHVYVYEPAEQGATTHAQLTQQEIVARVAATYLPVTALPPASEAAREAAGQIVGELQANDALLLLTSGNLGGLIETIPALAEQKFPIQKAKRLPESTTAREARTAAALRENLRKRKAQKEARKDKE